MQNSLRPSPLLKWIGTLFFAFPILYPFCSLLAFQLPLDRYLRIYLSPIFYLASLSALLAGFSLIKFRRWSWVALCWSCFFITLMNLLISLDYTHHSPAWIGLSLFSASLCFILWKAYQEIKVPHFLPKIPWWAEEEEYQSLPLATVSLEKEEEMITAPILDLDGQGCFLKTKKRFMLNERVTLKIPTKPPLQLEGNVVWITETYVTHPGGVGIRFKNIKNTYKKKLNQLREQLWIKTN